MIKPITPQQVSLTICKKIPDEVIDVFNKLIIECWTGKEATILQNEAVVRIMKALNITRRQVFALGLLNIGEVYRKAGWKVELDVPYSFEDYLTLFTFTTANNG